MTRLRLASRCMALLMAVITAMWSMPAHAQSDNGTVGDVAVVGNVNISREAILGVVATKTGQPFSLDTATRDVAAIRDLGYFQQVTHREETTANGVRVIFEVVENPKITAINVTGNTMVPTAKVIDMMTTKVGDVLNVQRFGKDLDKVQNYYHDQGFVAFVDVNQSNYVTPEGVLNVPIVEARIEAFRVTGNTKTRSNVILREIRTPLGAVYNQNRVIADLTRIYNTGYLEDITFTPEPGTTPDKIIINLKATEKKTGQVELGFGYSSEQGIIGRAGLSESNLKGTGQAVSVSAEVGGRFRNAGIPPLSLELNYFQPYLNKEQTSLSASLYNRTTYRFSNAVVGTTSGTGDAYEVRRGGSMGLGRPISDFTRVQLSLRTDNIRTFSPQDSGNVDGIRLDTENDSSVYSIGGSLVNDTRDDRQQDPSRGQLFTFGTEVGHTHLGGDPNNLDHNDEGRSGGFVKPGLDYRRYFALKPRKDLKTPTKVFAFRLKGGVASGPLSFFDQYFVGGADSLRGYSEDRFWGKNMVLANFELRIPFANNLQVVSFLDTGDAWGGTLRGNPQTYANFQNWLSHGEDSNGDGIPDPPPPGYTIYDAYEYRLPQHSTFSLHTGVGLGIRVKTPIGPIRLDYGISKEGGRTHFSIAQTF